MRILFVYPAMSTFVKQDYDILSKHFEVESLELARRGDIISLPGRMRNCDMSFTWFGAEHAYPVVLYSGMNRKPSIVVIGGYEVAWEPMYSYGAYFTWSRRTLIDFILHNATAILPVSDFTEREARSRVDRPMQRVYNAVDADYFKPDGLKENLVVTIANPSNYRIKGIDIFNEVAERFNGYQFKVIGLEKNLPPSAILDWLQRAKVYCQLSYRESFSVSTVEAMACGCIPVVTNRGALPEVVGNAGLMVPYGDADATANAIWKALGNPGLRTPARQRAKQFSVRRREDALLRIIEGLA